MTTPTPDQNQPYGGDPNQPYGAPQGQQPQQGYQQPQQGYQQPQQGYQQPSVADDRQAAALSHLLGGIFSWLGALISWLISKDKSPLADAEGKKALNFQITVVGAYIALAIFSGILIAANLGVLIFLVNLVWLGVWAGSLAFGIMNFNKVKNGQASSYPFSLELIK